MKLSDDKKTLRISIDAELSAVEIETLISDLSEFRASMEPPVPMERPRPGQTGSAERIQVQDEPSVMAVPLKDGRVRFWLRSHGLGWLAFNFTVSQAVSLREFFIANTPEKDSAPNVFFENGGGDQGSFH